jgi:hypothetical protein
MPRILIPPPRIPVTDPRTGAMSQAWYAFFSQSLQTTSDIIGGASVRMAALEVEDENLFIDHAMDVPPVALIDELRKRIEELETELSMITNPMAAIEELRKRVADLEVDLEMVR